MTPQEQANRIVDDWCGLADRTYEVDRKELRRMIAEALEEKDKIIAELTAKLGYLRNWMKGYRSNDP